MLIEAGCQFSEFGTRRRRTFKTQDIVVAAFKRASTEINGPGSLTGTSNVGLRQWILHYLDICL
jgi:nicotinate phosphoribosyltransferase